MSPTNGSVAPVCPISRSQAVPGMPGTLLLTVPRAVDLPSAIQAANAVAAILQQLGPGPTLNNVYPSLPFGYPSLAGNNSATQDAGSSSRKHSRWKEKSRVVERRRFYKPEDMHLPEKNRDVWVEVERITKIIWVDTSRGSTLTFEYGVGDEDWHSQVMK